MKSSQIIVGNKECWIISIESLADTVFPFENTYHPCLIYSTKRTTLAEKSEVATSLLLSSCNYILCAGIECEEWHDICDGIIVGDGDQTEEKDDGFVMTTWHTNETLREVIEFFVDISNIYSYQKHLVLIVGDTEPEIGMIKSILEEEFSRSNLKDD